MWPISTTQEIEQWHRCSIDHGIDCDIININNNDNNNDLEAEQDHGDLVESAAILTRSIRLTVLEHRV